MGWILRTLGSCVVIALAWAGACNSVDITGLDDPELVALEVDEWVAEELASGNAAEARGWLSQPDHTVFDGDSGEALDLVEALYAAGATGVWFTGVEEYDGQQSAASISAELPADASERQAMLRIEGRFWEMQPAPDVGQRFLDFSFD
jgi:hypothetical protein